MFHCVNRKCPAKSEQLSISQIAIGQSNRRVSISLLILKPDDEDGDYQWRLLMVGLPPRTHWPNLIFIDRRYLIGLPFTVVVSFKLIAWLNRVNWIALMRWVIDILRHSEFLSQLKAPATRVRAAVLKRPQFGGILNYLALSKFTSSLLHPWLSDALIKIFQV